MRVIVGLPRLPRDGQQPGRLRRRWGQQQPRHRARDRRRSWGQRRGGAGRAQPGIPGAGEGRAGLKAGLAGGAWKSRLPSVSAQRCQSCSGPVRTASSLSRGYRRCGHRQRDHRRRSHRGRRLLRSGRADRGQRHSRPSVTQALRRARVGPAKASPAAAIAPRIAAEAMELILKTNFI